MSEIDKNKRVAIILFNLGGPDQISNVRPFLYNLFSDKYIIRLPFLIRKIIAFFIAKFRTKSAIENYKLMGGKSPLLAETIKQKEALKIHLEKENFTNFNIFISMKYWHPFASEVIKEIAKYEPEEIIFLPLYPQFSSSTTLSSFTEFENLLKKANIKPQVKKIGCYFDNKVFISSHVELIKISLAKFESGEKLRILFSAHSIPKKFVAQGDPYEWQINKTVKAILQDSSINKHDTILCYQSKVGPIEWLTPSTEGEIERAAREGINLLIVPIAFVSEHIETLVELDIEYKKIADKYRIKYERVPSLGIDEKFIKSLADLVFNLTKNSDNTKCFGTEICPENFKNCICRRC